MVPVHNSCNVTPYILFHHNFDEQERRKKERKKEKKRKEKKRKEEYVPNIGQRSEYVVLRGLPLPVNAHCQGKRKGSRIAARNNKPGQTEGRTKIDHHPSDSTLSGSRSSVVGATGM